MNKIYKNPDIGGFDLKDSDYRKLVKIVYDCAGINLGDNKKELVHARISKILRKRSISGFGSYVNILADDKSGDELVSLLDAISTNVTHFFREAEHFKFITSEFSSSSNPSDIRFWSAGCSSGEEPYTIAITFREMWGNNSLRMPSILATDISTKVLGKAVGGLYPEKVTSNLDKTLLKKYFLKGKGKANGLIKLKKEIASMVDFQRLNLIEPFSFDKPFDCIMCRNVMIYFDNATREKLVAGYYNALKPDGYLIIGHSESLNGINHSFKYIKPTIYKKT